MPDPTRPREPKTRSACPSPVGTHVRARIQSCVKALGFCGCDVSIGSSRSHRLWLRTVNEGPDEHLHDQQDGQGKDRKHQGWRSRRRGASSRHATKSIEATARTTTPIASAAWTPESMRRSSKRPPPAKAATVTTPHRAPRRKVAVSFGSVICSTHPNTYVPTNRPARPKDL